MVAAMGIAIVADALSKTYRSYRKQDGLVGALKGLFARQYDQVDAAKNVSFEIEEGEFVGFLGPNGAGKTTVLKMLAGLLVPTSGTARVLGYIPWERKAPFKRQFSLVLGQKNSLWWDLPARESLELNRAIYEIDGPHVLVSPEWAKAGEVGLVFDDPKQIRKELKMGAVVNFQFLIPPAN